MFLKNRIGTQIYSEISKRVFERKKNEEETFKALKMERSMIDLPQKEEVVSERIRYQTLTQDKERLRKEEELFREKLQKSITFIETRAELDAIRSQLAKINDEIKVLSGMADRVAKAKAFVTIKPFYENILDREQQFKKTVETLKILENDINDMQSAYRVQQEAILLAEERFQMLHKQWLEKQSDLEQALSWSDAKRRLKIEIDRIQLDIDAKTKQVNQWSKEMNELHWRLQDINSWQMIDDETWWSLKEELTSVLAMEKIYRENGRIVNEQQLIVDQKITEKIALEHRLRDLQKEINERRPRLTTEKQQALLNAFLPSLRKNDPCPICHHPLDDIPVMAKTDDAWIQETEQMITEMQDMTSKLSILSSSIAMMEASNDERLRQNLEIAVQLDKALKAVNGFLGKSYVTVSDAIAALDQKRHEQNEWLEQKRKINETINRLNLDISNGQLALHELCEVVDAKQKEIENLSQVIEKITGGVDPVILKETLWSNRQNAERDFQEKKTMAQALKDKISEKTAKQSGLISEIGLLRSRLEEETHHFQESMSVNGFSSIDEFLNASIPESDIVLFDQTMNHLNSEKSKHESLFHEKERILSSMAMEKPEDVESLSKRLQEVTDRLELTISEIAKLNSFFERYEQLKQKASSLDMAIAKQSSYLAQWQIMNKMIGSQDGKSYRNFAQAMTFDQLLFEANRYLSKMTDRYVLIREGTLDIVVEDQWQGGQRRTVKNLSGGESFMVSLALSFGLSSLSSGNLRVDSFFLDEGFGSLDESSLAMVMDALSSMMEDGKMIGIVSHVPALADRIPLKIEVVSKGEKSFLRGIGLSNKSIRHVF